MTVVFPEGVAGAGDPLASKELLRVVRVSGVHPQESRPDLVTVILSLSRTVDSYDAQVRGARPRLRRGLDTITVENAAPGQIRKIVREMNSWLEEVSATAEQSRSQAREALSVALEGLEELNRDLE